MVRVDTNYIIRYLINDDAEMATKATEVLMNEHVFIANEVLAEVVYVLLGVYGIARKDIANELVKLIRFKNISVSDQITIEKAFRLFGETKLDFVDCLLCAYSQKDSILTFDKKLNKCIKNI